MKKLVRQILREPLLHFLLLGAVLYTAHAVATATDGKKILLSEREINNYLRAHNRNAPILRDEDSLYLTRRLITRKVLLTEAFNRDYHLYDPGVTERLIDRMQLALMADTVPDEAHARQYYESNADRYQPDSGIPLGFEAVRSQVMNDLMMQLREESYQQNLHELMDQYTVKIAKP